MYIEQITKMAYGVDGNKYKRVHNRETWIDFLNTRIKETKKHFGCISEKKHYLKLLAKMNKLRIS